MQSAKQIYNEAVNRISKKYELSEAKSIAAILLEDSFDVKREDVLLDEEVEIESSHLERLIQRILQNEPVQYVTGLSHFLGRKFQVRKGVLIPRPETEELVRLIVESNKVAKPRILDVGTGSGCIAISLALETRGNVVGLDVSEDALNIAKENSSALGGSIEFLHHDILTSYPSIADLDILVSNPPYIPEADKKRMQDNVLDYEPEEALFVPDNDPLIFYKKIGEFGRQSLKAKGRLYFELHEQYAEEVKSLILSLGCSEVRIHEDMQGKKRMLSATNSASR